MSLRRRLARFPQEVSRALGPLSAHEYQQLVSMYERTQWFQPTELEKRSFRSFSQSNEDGLIAAILHDLGKSGPGNFIEMGIGDGTENNTLLLAMSGWQGMWFGGEDLSLELPTQGPVVFKKGWIDLNNIIELKNQAVSQLGDNIDVFSLDLDGNDYHFAEQLLEDGFKPTVWIHEYNGVFGPTCEWIMPADNTHQWARNNNFGASYMSFVKLFARYGYKPVVCSYNGANVFFVRTDTGMQFPEDPVALWRPPVYFEFRHAHPVTPKLFAGITKNTAP
jgi:hypothetical protein